VDSAADRFIKFAESVTSEEEDSFIVLQASYENGHETVACDVLPNTLLQVYFCLIKEKNGIPMICQLKDTT